YTHLRGLHASSHRYYFFLKLRRPPPSPLFPYTALFRSVCAGRPWRRWCRCRTWGMVLVVVGSDRPRMPARVEPASAGGQIRPRADRKSTRLNSSHVKISYAVFCLKKKKQRNIERNGGQG